MQPVLEASSWGRSGNNPRGMPPWKDVLASLGSGKSGMVFCGKSHRAEGNCGQWLQASICRAGGEGKQLRSSLGNIQSTLIRC